MTTYDKVTQLLGQASVALLGAQATGVAPKGYLPVWLVIAAWVISHLASATSNAMVKMPSATPPAPPAPPAVGVLALFACLSVLSCGTFKSPPVNTAVSCVATDLIGDVNNALVSGDWVGQLEILATKCGLEVLTSVVRHVGAESAHAAQASGNELESTKADRARSWLAAHGKNE
jgi:hypothetical protein